MGTRPPRQPVVLLVDDDEAFLRVLGKALQRRGFEVLTATDAESALAAAAANGPDHAVVDLKLGDDSGLDLVPRLKAAVPVRSRWAAWR